MIGPLPHVASTAHRRPGKDEDLFLNEFSTLLSSLGFSTEICNWMTTIQRIIQVEDLLALYKDIVTTVFTHLDGAHIHYTGAQMSLFRALHHYPRRIDHLNIPIDPTIISRVTLIEEMNGRDGISSKHKERRI